MSNRDQLEQREFNNWLNTEGKEDFIWALRELNAGKPGVVRYLLERAFKAGIKAAHGEEEVY